VTKAEPCKVCGGSDWCRESGDGAVAWCGRQDQGSFRKGQRGGWLHRLRDDRPSGSNGDAPRPRPAPAPAGKIHETAQHATDAAQRGVETETGQAATLAGKWPYIVNGVEAMRVLRFNLADGDKRYRPIHPHKGGWKIGDPAGPLPLYRADDLAGAATIWIAEGERCADEIRSVGLVGTTSAHGSSAAERSDWAPLKDKAAIIVPDHDAPGAKYARDVARLAFKAGARSVKLVQLAGLSDGQDVVDWLVQGGRDCRDVLDLRRELEALAAAAPELDPSSIIGGPVLTCLADISPVPVKWLWPGRIPAGRITMIVGRPGEGKSFLATDLAARVTTGTPWPDGAPCSGGSVILVSAEDDPGDTIRPRLDAHRADCRRVHLLSMVRQIGEDGKPFDVLFTLANVRELETALQAHPDCKLVVVDPIGSYMGGKVDGNAENEVRGILAPVAKLAEQYGPAVLIVAHRRKASANIADDLAIGSRAFTGIARAVWHLSRDPNNKARRLLLPGKLNLSAEGTGLAFAICGEPPALAWERDPVTMSADDALAEERESDGRGRPADERDAATVWLRCELSSGAAVSVDTLRAAAQEAGLAWRSVQRAAADLRVARHREGFGGGCTWQLPAAPIRATTPENGNIGTNGTYDETPTKTGGTYVPESHTCQHISLGTNGDDDRAPDDLDYMMAEALAQASKQQGELVDAGRMEQTP
jgi:hypothetical protein